MNVWGRRTEIDASGKVISVLCYQLTAPFCPLTLVSSFWWLVIRLYINPTPCFFHMAWAVILLYARVNVIRPPLLCPLWWRLNTGPCVCLEVLYCCCVLIFSPSTHPPKGWDYRPAPVCIDSFYQGSQWLCSFIFTLLCNPTLNVEDPKELLIRMCCGKTVKVAIPGLGLLSFPFFPPSLISF